MLSKRYESTKELMKMENFSLTSFITSSYFFPVDPTIAIVVLASDWLTYVDFTSILQPLNEI